MTDLALARQCQKRCGLRPYIRSHDCRRCECLPAIIRLGCQAAREQMQARRKEESNGHQH